MVTYNEAIITSDENGNSFLTLEIQAVLGDQIITIRNTFPKTTNSQTGACQHQDTVSNLRLTGNENNI